MNFSLANVVKLTVASTLGIGGVSMLKNAGPLKAQTPDHVEMVSMRDGVRLSARVYLPAEVPEGGVPTLLMRTPYRFPGEGGRYYAETARFHAGRGYAFVVQDCRGRFDSEGTFKPFEMETEDGHDTITWIVAQKWSNGRVGTIGGSYNGFTALAAAVRNEHVSTVIVDDPAADFSYGLRGGTASMLPLFWLYLVDHGRWPSQDEKAAASNALDLPALDERLLGHDAEFWNLYVSATQSSERMWATRSVSSRASEICAPMLIVKSRSEPWEDPVQLWQTARTTGCEEYRQDHRLIITAETHTYHLAKLGFETTQVNEQMTNWVDKWLGGREVAAGATAAVQFRAPTDEGYRAASDWPPATQEKVLYLANPNHVRANAPLFESQPSADGTDSFEIDPAKLDPCRTYPNMSYVSAPLTEPLYLAGSVRGELRVSTSGRDADFSVLLYEYNDKDRTPLQYVTFGTARASALTTVVPDQPFSIVIDMHSLAHEFRAGSRIAIAVTGTLCGYAENPHTGEPTDQQSEWRSATYGIHHGPRESSRIVLPVLTTASR